MGKSESIVGLESFVVYPLIFESHNEIVPFLFAPSGNLNSEEFIFIYLK